MRGPSTPPSPADPPAVWRNRPYRSIAAARGGCGWGWGHGTGGSEPGSNHVRVWARSFWTRSFGTIPSVRSAGFGGGRPGGPAELVERLGGAVKGRAAFEANSRDFANHGRYSWWPHCWFRRDPTAGYRASIGRSGPSFTPFQFPIRAACCLLVRETPNTWLWGPGPVFVPEAMRQRRRRRVHGSRGFATSARGRISQNATGRSLVVPALMWPGQRAMSRTRIPPSSKGHAEAPSGPELRKKAGSTPDLHGAIVAGKENQRLVVVEMSLLQIREGEPTMGVGGR